MPCLWGLHNNSQVFLDVGVIDAASLTTPAMPGVGTGAPTLFKSLVDTGCQRTMISANAAARLGLTAVGKIPIQGVGPNITYHNAYVFRVAFFVPAVAGGQMPGSGAAVAHVLPAPIHGGEISSSGFDVLLGMDVISIGSLKIEGNGAFSFSF